MSYGEVWCQLVPHGSVTSMRSTLSGVVWEVLRERDFEPSPTRIWEEEGVGRVEWDGVRLGPGSPWSWLDWGCVLIGGKEGEKTEGGRAPGRIWEGGMRWTFL